GDGALFLNGSVANSYTGPTRIEGGAVHLAKTSGAQAISAVVTIDGNLPGTPSLSDDLPGQYPPQLSMVITNGGVWRITNGATVTNLVLSASDLRGSGLLNLECDVVSYGFCEILCSLNLGNQSRTFFVYDLQFVQGWLDMSGSVIGPLGPNSAGIIKDGAGELVLKSQNTYLGPTVVRD